MKNKQKKENNDTTLQPILFTEEQYKELLRSIGAYALLKQSSIAPSLDPTGLDDYVMSQGEKFGFEKIKIDETDWFDEINAEVFESLFRYSQEEMWQHLANMLAQRDVRNEIEDKTGLDEAELPSGMFLDAMAKKVQMYLKEFEKNGINNIIVTCKDNRVSSLDVKSK